MTARPEGDWYELTVVVPAESAEAAGALLLGAGCPGLAQQGEDPVTLTGAIPAEETTPDALEDLVDALGDLPRHGLLAPIDIDVKGVQEVDWANAWKMHFKPLEIGRRLVVKPTWDAYTTDPRRVVVELDPGMAFGTGTHPTTRLCLEALDEFVAPGVAVADIGTGSGILAIAAARLGAAIVYATDIDALPRKVARENVARNSLDGVVRVLEMDAFDGAARACGIVVANILASTIVELMPTIRPRIAPGGLFIGSGIVEERLPSVLDALGAAGLQLVTTSSDDVWRCVVARAPADA